ncbi:transcription antiterminator [Escherichia coli]|nr:transcription antiterminator [Escherichia coli]
MTISSRTRAIIQFIRRNDRYISVKDIAEKLDLTERTIYRELPEVNQVVSEFGLKLDSVIGKGMKLSGPAKGFDGLDELIASSPETAYSTTERIAIIQFLLLQSKGYVKTQALAIDSKASLQTVRNDLKQVEINLRRESLVIIVKKSEGISIEGNELDKSHCMAKLLAQSVDIDFFLTWVTDGKDKGQPLLQMLYQYGYHGTACNVFNLVLRLTKKYDIRIADNCLRDLVLLITIFFKKFGIESLYTGFKYEGTLTNKNEKSFTDELIHQCSLSLNVTMTKEEAGYLNWLSGVLVGDPNDRTFDLEKVRIVKQADQLVEEIETRLGLQLRNDKYLIEGLSAHLNRTIARIRSGMIISNPINKGIEQSYQDLFKIVRECTSLVFSDIEFPDEEIGYLVLYVAMALDNIADKSFRVLVVCTSGMGSSKLLASRLEREIAEIKIQKLIALIDLYSENLDDYDLVISTVPLYIQHENCITVSALLTEQEADQVKQRIRRHRTKKLSHISASRTRIRSNKRTAPLTYLKQVNAISTWGIELLDKLNIYSSIGLQTDLIKGLGALTYRLGMIPNANYLMENSQNNNSCFIVPNSNVAYSEFCLKELSAPTLLAIKLDVNKGYTFGNLQHININSMIVLFYPHWSDPVYVDFLHDIALMIIESSLCVDAFERSDREAIVTIVGERIAEYVSNMDY